jgi:hypothetical protein
MCDVNGELVAIGEYDASRKDLHPHVVLAQEN